MVTLAVGCSGGNEPMTRSVFRREVSKVCQRANDRFAQLPEIVIDPEPRDRSRNVAKSVTLHIEASEKMLRDLRALVPPKRDARMADKWIAVLEQVVSELHQLRTAIRDDPARATDTMIRIVQLVVRGVELAQESNIVACRPPLEIPSA